MLLGIHIIISCIASIVAITSAARLYRSRSSLPKGLRTSLVTSVAFSALTGVGLIFTGVSVARVCIEAGALIGTAFALTAYSRKFQLAKEEI